MERIHHLEGCSINRGHLSPQYLPHVVQQVSPFLPTRQFANLLWSALGSTPVLYDATGLGIYSLAFFALAAIGYRRDERKRYA
jgi:hypothetical protein